jgi:hypothetical protein
MKPKQTEYLWRDYLLTKKQLRQILDVDEWNEFFKYEIKKKLMKKRKK